QKVYRYRDSLTFANMVKNNVKDEDLQSSVLNVTKIFREIVIEHYQKICNSYKDWYNINYSEAQIFWKDITKEQVKHELEIMASKKSLYRRHQNQNDLIASIKYLALIPSYIEHLKLRDTDKSWAVKILKDLQNDGMKLDMLSDIFQNLDRNFNELNKCTWFLVKKLNSADEFNKYLLENLIGRDLTNLINEDSKNKALQQLYQLRPDLNGQKKHAYVYDTITQKRFSSFSAWIKALSSQRFFKGKKLALATIFLKPNCNKMNIGQIIKGKNYSPYIQNVILLSIKDTLTTIIYNDIELIGINLREGEEFLCFTFFETNLKKELYIKKTIHGYQEPIKCTIFVNGLEVRDNFLEKNGQCTKGKYI
ncbi:33381_t:CDS:2, partial [Gigaspora margarita]